jgi:hypothetical protein
MLIQSNTRDPVRSEVDVNYCKDLTSADHACLKDMETSGFNARQKERARRMFDHPVSFGFTDISPERWDSIFGKRKRTA